jgi:hypothetical protein
MRAVFSDSLQKTSNHLYVGKDSKSEEISRREEILKREDESRAYT